MFVEIDALCKKGNKALEDRIGYSDSWLFVIDGASGLTGKKVTEYDSDAAWLADKLKTKLETLLPVKEMSVQEILKNISCDLQKEYGELWQKKYDTDVDYPSAGIAILRLKDENIEYFGLGDCTLVLEKQDGSIEVFLEEKLAALDQAAIDKMASVQKETKCTMKEAREAINPLLIRNRNLRNKPDGYWIYDPCGDGIDNARTASWSFCDIKSVTLMSDGFAQLVQTFNIVKDFDELQVKIKEMGLESLTRKLFEAQDGDPECINFPRFKLRDDTSAVYAEIKNI